MKVAVIAASRHHQHVEHDDRRQRQDHRPDADGPHDVFGRKSLLRDGIVAFEVHDAPPRLFVAPAQFDTRPVLKTWLRFRLHLIALAIPEEPPAAYWLMVGEGEASTLSEAAAATLEFYR